MDRTRLKDVMSIIGGYEEAYSENLNKDKLKASRAVQDLLKYAKEAKSTADNVILEYENMDKVQRNSRKLSELNSLKRELQRKIDEYRYK